MIFTTLTALGVGGGKMGSFGRVCEQIILGRDRLGRVVWDIWVGIDEVARLLPSMKIDRTVCPPPYSTVNVSVFFLVSTLHDQADTGPRILTIAGGCQRVGKLLGGVDTSPTFVNRKMGGGYRLGFVVYFVAVCHMYYVL